jgi:hypothetical protein
MRRRRLAMASILAFVGRSFICRKGGGRVLAAVLGLAACGGVHAQTPRFYARERGAAVARDDAAVAVATWEDESTHTKWVYTAGWVTQNDASGNPHKRLAVFRYNEEDENLPPPIDPPGPGYGLWEDEAFFPPGANWTPVGQHAATSMTIDRDGNVYVCGYTTLEQNGDNGSDLNYIIIKYLNDLTEPTQTWNSGTTWGGVSNARGYDHSSHGDDVACSIGVIQSDEGVGDVIVTGTSSNGSDNDIATLRFNPDGTAHWDNGGVRRFDREGEDTAAEIGYMTLVDEFEETGVYVVVVGTSDNGSDLDRVVLCYTPSGDDSGDPGWRSYYDGGGDDHGTGFARYQATESETPVLFVCGYSDAQAGGTDFVVSSLNPMSGVTSQPTPSPYWTRTHSFGGADVALDMALGSWGNVTLGDTLVFVTGRANISGSDRVATLCYTGSAGNLAGTATYAPVPGAGNVGNAVTADGTTCWVSGTTLTAVAEPELLLVSYTVDPDTLTLTTDWSVVFPADGSHLADAGLAVARGLLDDVVAAGQSTYSTGSLTDSIVFRVELP